MKSIIGWSKKIYWKYKLKKKIKRYQKQDPFIYK